MGPTTNTPAIPTYLPIRIYIHLGAILAGYAPHTPADIERARVAYLAARGGVS